MFGERAVGPWTRARPGNIMLQAAAASAAYGRYFMWSSIGGGVVDRVRRGRWRLCPFVADVGGRRPRLDGRLIAVQRSARATPARHVIWILFAHMLNGLKATRVPIYI